MPALLLGALILLAGGLAPGAASDAGDGGTASPADTTSRRLPPRIAVGASVALFQPARMNADRSIRIQPLVRLGRRAGWGAAIEFNWFDTDITSSIGGEQAPMGRLRVRPILAGISYRVPSRAVSVSLSLLGGYAFTTADSDEQDREGLRSRLGIAVTSVEADNSLAFSAGVSISYSLSSRISLVGSAGYVLTRPKVTVVTNLGRETVTWKADSVILKIGVAHGIL